MWQERTCEWLECQIGIRRAGQIEDCGSAVATPNGSSLKERRQTKFLKFKIYAVDFLSIEMAKNITFLTIDLEGLHFVF